MTADLLLQHVPIQQKQKEYQAAGIDMRPILDDAIANVTKGIDNPHSRQIVQKVLVYLAGYLKGKLQEKPAHTRAGRWIRAALSFFNI